MDASYVNKHPTMICLIMNEEKIKYSGTFFVTKQQDSSKLLLLNRICY